MKFTNGVMTKYVYGRGLIGEETNGEFKTYHFDSRGSTVAITDENGAITDTFAYDTYGKLLARTGTSDIIFQYNGRDGVVTEPNGLIYMRARYYSPTLRRFINADIVAGEITNAITLNRFVYANGNPISNIDPLGLTSAALFSGEETDLDPTDDYEYGSSRGGGYSGSGYGSSGAEWTGYDHSVYSGGSYHNYLVRNGTASYDANLGGYHYQGTSTSFSNIGQYYVPGAVSAYKPVLKTQVHGKSHGSDEHKAGIDKGASKMEMSGKYSDIWLNKSLKTAGLVGNKRPDIIARTHGGEYEYYEYGSKTQAPGTYGHTMLVEKMKIIDNANNLRGVLINWGEY